MALAPSTRAKLVDSAVADDAHEPAQEAATVLGVGLGAAPEADEHVLGGVFGQLGVAKDTEARRIYEGGVPVIEHIERGLIATDDGGHQLFVAERCEGGSPVARVGTVARQDDRGW
jgi:hypothetical protein